MTCNKILYSKKSFNYFIQYKDDAKIKPLGIMLLKMIGYVKCFDKTKYMSLLIEDEK